VTARPVDPSLPRRGLRRVGAAVYLGVSPALFDALVADGTLPPPKLLRGAVVWDRIELDTYFEAIPSGARRPRKRSGDDGVEP
jgi:predicted DNA-binding transcriptional regulator AlpA